MRGQNHFCLVAYVAAGFFKGFFWGGGGAGGRPGGGASTIELSAILIIGCAMFHFPLQLTGT